MMEAKPYHPPCVKFVSKGVMINVSVQPNVGRRKRGNL